jgi:hypothetical protein
VRRLIKLAVFVVGINRLNVGQRMLILRSGIDIFPSAWYPLRLTAIVSKRQSTSSRLWSVISTIFAIKDP